MSAGRQQYDTNLAKLLMKEYLHFRNPNWNLDELNRRKLECEEIERRLDSLNSLNDKIELWVWLYDLSLKYSQENDTMLGKTRKVFKSVAMWAGTVKEEPLPNKSHRALLFFAIKSLCIASTLEFSQAEYDEKINETRQELARVDKELCALYVVNKQITPEQHEARDKLSHKLRAMGDMEEFYKWFIHRRLDLPDNNEIASMPCRDFLNRDMPVEHQNDWYNNYFKIMIEQNPERRAYFYKEANYQNSEGKLTDLRTLHIEGNVFVDPEGHRIPGSELRAERVNSELALTRGP